MLRRMKIPKCWCVVLDDVVDYDEDYYYYHYDCDDYDDDDNDDDGDDCGKSDLPWIEHIDSENVSVSL